jgi:hypothetical protein
LIFTIEVAGQQLETLNGSDLKGSSYSITYNIIPVLKHRKFWIISNFATTGKRYILASYMVACSGMGIKNYYIVIYLKKPYQRKELKKMYEKINGAPREGA